MKPMSQKIFEYVGNKRNRKNNWYDNKKLSSVIFADATPRNEENRAHN